MTAPCPCTANTHLRAATRAGHARPLPRGFGADVTRIAAVGRHAPMPPKVCVAACLTGCRARAGGGVKTPSLRTNVHGCFVGGGLDRSVPVSGKRAFTGSHQGRACPAPTARLWGRCYLYYSRRAACPHAAEGMRGRPFNGLPRKADGGVKTPSLRTNVHGCFVGSGLDPLRARVRQRKCPRERHRPYLIASAISASVRVLRTG